MLTHPDLQKALDAIDHVTHDLDAHALDQRPGAAWSIAQVLEHLARAYSATADLLDGSVRDGAAKGRTPSLLQRLYATLIVDLGYFPSGVKAPAITIPAGLPGAEALALARRQLIALDAAAARCLARFGPRVRVANHPLLGGFTVPQWQRFHWRHTTHHVRQIAARRP